MMDVLEYVRTHFVNIAQQHFVEFVYEQQPTTCEQHLNAYKQSIVLLKSWLTPQQRHELEVHHYFSVRGSKTDVTYKIHYHSESFNVQSTAHFNQFMCFGPLGNLPLGDRMLVQKIMLENDEEEVLRIANCIRGGSPYAPTPGTEGLGDREGGWNVI